MFVVVNSKIQKPLRAAIYARQSINNLDGIENQVNNCEKLCELRGWEIVETFQDNDVSAHKRRGADTAWGKMLVAIDNQDIDVVVAVNLDRLLRSLSDLTTLIERNAKVLTVDGEIDLTSAEGEFQATFLAALARFETNRKSERQLRANRAKAARGKPVPTRRRFGYETDGCTPREEEAAIVRSLFEGFAAGRSLRSMAIELKESNATVGGGKTWSPLRVRSILANPFYAGRSVHLGTVVESEYVIPIVGSEQFDATNAILKDPARKTSPGSEIRHLLSGVAECGVCGAKLNYTTGYKCNKRNDHVFIKKETLEKAVLEYIASWMSDNRDNPWSKWDSARLKELLVQSGKLAKESQEITLLLTTRGVDVATVRSKLNSLADEYDDIQAKIVAERSSSTLAQSIELIRAFWNQPKSPIPYDPERTNPFGFTGVDGHPLDIPEGQFDDYAKDAAFFENWPDLWNGMPLNLKRELLKSLFKITLNKGRDVSRIQISTLE
jgi:site-specific DNA recombinase